MAITIPDFNESKKITIPKFDEEEEKKIKIPDLESNVLEGSVMDRNAFKDPDIDFFDAVNLEWQDFKDQVLVKTYGGAARDLAQGTIDFTNWVSQKFGKEDKLIDYELDKIEEPEYFGGSFMRDVLGFLGGFKGIDKIQKVTPVVKNIPKANNKVLRSGQIILKGGAAEQVAFSPYEKRISNLIETGADGKFSNFVTDYLQADDQDTEDQARAKMFVEGGAIGVPFEVIGNYIKAKSRVSNNTKKLNDKDISKIEKDGENKFNKFKKQEKTKTEINFKIGDEVFIDNKGTKGIIKKKFFINKSASKNIDDLDKYEVELPDGKKGSITKTKLKQFNKNKNLDDLKIEAEKLKIKLDKPSTLEGVNVPQKITKPALKSDITNKIDRAAEELLVTGRIERNPNLLISEQIADLITSPARLTAKNFEDILKKYDVSLDEFASYYVGDVADAGRRLQSLSVISRKLKEIEKLPDGKKAFEDISKVAGSSTSDLVGGFWRRLDNVRRGLMVTQLATAVRNFESQVTRVGVNTLQKSFDNAMQTVGGYLFPSWRGAAKANPTEAFKGFANIFRQFKRSNFKKVKADTDKILSSFATQQDRLFLRYSSDVVNTTGKFTGRPIEALEKATHFLNFANRFQEFITRRAVFQSELAEIIANNKSLYKGQTLEDLVKNNNTKSIREEDIAKAIDTALEVTFAKEFDDNTFGGLFIRLINKIPFTGSLAIPYPRFLVNSLKFHLEFSPTGLLKFLSKTEREAIAKGDTSTISKAAIGTAMLTTAYYLRNQEYAGEKWYEFRWGDKTIDTRPLNPFAAYLFVADTVKRLNDGTFRTLDLKGIASVFLGTRGGTGLYLVDRLIDAFTGENPALKTDEEIKKFATKILTGFAVPLQQFQDAAGQFFPEMAKVKDTSSAPIKGEFLKRIPIPNDYPTLVSATSYQINDKGLPVAKEIIREEPLYRQFTGVTLISAKNAAEKELDRLGFTSREIFQRSGIPELDFAYKNIYAVRIGLGLSEIVKSQQYQNLNNELKVFFVKSYLANAKSETMKSLQKNNDLAPYILKYKIENLSKEKRRAIDSLIGKDYLDEIINEYIDKNKKKQNKIEIPDF
nr:hypothetical protein [uncultured Mediterranean phage uvMED]|tara:strand:+ start:598 stop:3882 length:3285 start_codon:yes stop_codon:yes gene_type:complete